MAGNDDKAAWAEICVDFHNIKLDAARLHLRQQWEALARATPAGRGTLADWSRLVADIAAADGVDQMFSGRPDGPGRVARNLRAVIGARTDGDYECPAGLCGRRASTRTGVAPMCDLLNARMRAARSG